MAEALDPLGRCLSGRFELREWLGSGTFGDVYLAYDRRLDQEVAVKVLRQLDGDARLAFKGEFRGTTRLVHDGIVRLRELHTDDGWYVTMELARGPTLLEYVRESDSYDLRRLKSAFGQLVDAVSALHASGQLHRDLKPSNVRVVDGRVRVLDFGFAQPLGRKAGGLVGSPRYMAPEQIEGEAQREASDWYAVGVMLYEALCGRPPFEGRPLQVMVRKRQYDAPALDEPYGRLVASLLQRDSSERADGNAIREALGLKSAQAQTRQEIFVGRTDPLRRLDGAWAALRTGDAARSVWIAGEPGSGKTALLRCFVQSLPAERVFLSRCYEGESVPFAGADALVDQVARWLRRTGDLSVVPKHFDTLISLFPVLEGIGGHTARTGADPVAARRTAFYALRELLTSMAAFLGGPLLVAVDDLQWGDPDGAELLRFLSTGADAVPMLLVGAFRTQAQTRLKWLRSLTEDEGRETIALAPLSLRDTETLARALLGNAQSSRAEAIAKVARGNPLLVQMLARGGALGDLRSAVRAQAEALSPHALRLLKLVCVARQPVPKGALIRRLGQGSDRAIADLASRDLVLTSARLERETVEAYHDRIRTAVVEDIPEGELAEVHDEIARTWIELGGDPETIARHLGAAGDDAAAAEWTVRAAEVAAASLAWAKAADLYERALAYKPLASQRALWAALGDTRGHLGRGVDAAVAYRRAMACPDSTPQATELHDVELLRRIAEHLLRCGEMVEGVRALDDALRSVKLRWPRHPLEAVGRMAATRAELRVRGLGFRARPARAIRPAELRRIDLCWSAGIGLSSVDSLRGAALQAQGLLFALRAGEPVRVARALAYEAAFQGNQGPKNARRCERLLERALQIARDEDSDYLFALVEGARCVVAFHQGAWGAACEAGARAEQRFDDASVGMVKEIATVQLLSMASSVFQGKFAEVDERLPDLAADAATRRDRFTLASFRSGFLSLTSLAADQPAEGRSAAAHASSGFSSPAYVVQDFFDLWAQTQFDLYEGRCRRAHERMRAGLAPFRRSLLARLPLLRAFAEDIAGRAALAGHRQGVRGALRQAKRHAHALHAVKQTWTSGLAHGLEASIAIAEGRSPREALRSGARSFDACGMQSHAATLRVVLGDAEGERALRRLNVVAPDKWVRSWMPSWRG